MPGFVPTSSRCPTTPRPAQRRQPLGFTLVELLTVIVIISILSAMAMGVTQAVKLKQSMSKARSELAIIHQALDQFKKDYGDYPPMDNDQGSGSPYAEQNLLMAITGHARWVTDPSTGLQKWEYVSMSKKENDGSTLPSGGVYNWGKKYNIELSKFTVDLDSSTDSGIKDGAMLHDPWWDGQPEHNGYLYRYKVRNDKIDLTNRNWQTPTFLIVSRGPDGKPLDADANFIWKPANKRSQYTGLLTDDYSDPVTNPDLADNLVEGSETR